MVDKAAINALLDDFHLALNVAEIPVKKPELIEQYEYFAVVDGEEKNDVAVFAMSVGNDIVVYPIKGRTARLGGVSEVNDAKWGVDKTVVSSNYPREPDDIDVVNAGVFDRPHDAMLAAVHLYIDAQIEGAWESKAIERDIKENSFDDEGPGI